MMAAGVEADSITLWLAGDVMTGRGIDQVMAHHVEPKLYEPWVNDAREYVRLAERVHGTVPAPVGADYIWGAALAEITRHKPDVRLVNLETAITAGGQPWASKGIHYRMHPANVDCLTAAGIQCCALANNHVLDWGVGGLKDTLNVLGQMGIQSAGAGVDDIAASAPAVLPLAGGGRLLVFSWATLDSGVLPGWRAAPEHPGVAVLTELNEAAAQQVADAVERHRRVGDRVVLSIHWGGNWGLSVSHAQRQLAHRLIDWGVADVVHGHSSHHPRPIEVYRDRLILYGCGDLINDYEGIGHEGPFDSSAVCLYFARLSRASGALLQLEIVPMQLRRLRLIPVASAGRESLIHLFNAAPAPFHTRLEVRDDGRWLLAWS